MIDRYELLSKSLINAILENKKQAETIARLEIDRDGLARKLYALRNAILDLEDAVDGTMISFGSAWSKVKEALK